MESLEVNGPRNSYDRARYADLVWDMAPAIAGKRRDPTYARMAIDAYFEAVSTDRYPDAYNISSLGPTGWICSTT